MDTVRGRFGAAALRAWRHHSLTSLRWRCSWCHPGTGSQSTTAYSWDGSLSDATGKAVKRLKAGSYKFVIHDGSALHSFALDGPNGFAKDFTTVPFKGTKTVTINLRKGKYKYYCAAHESTMFGHFTVT